MRIEITFDNPTAPRRKAGNRCLPRCGAFLFAPLAAHRLLTKEIHTGFDV
jgi:hypothetical protein